CWLVEGGAVKGGGVGPAAAPGDHEVWRRRFPARRQTAATPRMAGAEGSGTGTVMVVLPRVTAPLIARARPSRLAPAFRVIEVSARMEPAKSAEVLRVAELPTCQKTVEASAPLARMIWLPEAASRVEVVWKIQTMLESPPASSVRVVLMRNDSALEWTPPMRV